MAAAGPILLVDSDPKVLRLLEATLRLRGFETERAETGRRAEQAAAQVAPSLIIAESRLADMDGLELVERVRGAPGGSTRPFLFLSSRPEQLERLGALGLPQEAFLRKPFAIDELLRRVQAVLRPEAPEPAAPRQLDGPLGSTSFGDLIASLAQRGWSGELRVEVAGGPPGARVAFSDGRIVDATWGLLRGVHAVLQLFTRLAGRYELAPEAGHGHNVLDSTVRILAEALRLVEAGHLRKVQPDHPEASTTFVLLMSEVAPTLKPPRPEPPAPVPTRKPVLSVPARGEPKPNGAAILGAAGASRSSDAPSIRPTPRLPPVAAPARAPLRLVAEPEAATQPLSVIDEVEAPSPFGDSAFETEPVPEGGADSGAAPADLVGDVPILLAGRSGAPAEEPEEAAGHSMIALGEDDDGVDDAFAADPAGLSISHVGDEVMEEDAVAEVAADHDPVVSLPDAPAFDFDAADISDDEAVEGADEGPEEQWSGLDGAEIAASITNLLEAIEEEPVEGAVVLGEDGTLDGPGAFALAGDDDEDDEESLGEHVDDVEEASVLDAEDGIPTLLPPVAPTASGEVTAIQMIEDTAYEVPRITHVDLPAPADVMGLYESLRAAVVDQCSAVDAQLCTRSGRVVASTIRDDERRGTVAAFASQAIRFATTDADGTRYATLDAGDLHVVVVAADDRRVFAALFDHRPDVARVLSSLRGILPRG